jgi:hypothetical protein
LTQQQQDAIVKASQTKRKPTRDRDMKFTVTKKCEIDVQVVRISVPVRYEEEDIPNDFPLRNLDIWQGTVNIETGQILEWPKGQSGNLQMKVTDSGVYVLLDSEREVIEELCCYVPHGLVPGEYGDYINLEINEDGVITNWPSDPRIDEFFPSDDD